MAPSPVLSAATASLRGNLRSADMIRVCSEGKATRTVHFRLLEDDLQKGIGLSCHPREERGAYFSFTPSAS